MRVRFATNDPTPWPPELPAGENPPAGAVVDYYLPTEANNIKLEFLDAQQNVLRTYSTSDAVRSPDPANDPAGYDRLCQQTPNAPDCGLPLYWPAPPQVLKTAIGMHRFTWDMHYNVVPGTGGGGRGGDGANGAVPHRTYPGIHSPWIAPGLYTVRLTVDGKSQTQPIKIVMDPRVKITPEVEQIFTMTKQAETAAINAAKARADAISLEEKLKAGTGSESAKVKLKKLDQLAPEKAAEQTAAAGPPAFGPGPDLLSAPSTLTNIGGQLITAIMSMQASEMPPTAAELDACKKQYAKYTALMTQWSALKTSAK